MCLMEIINVKLSFGISKKHHQSRRAFLNFHYQWVYGSSYTRFKGLGTRILPEIRLAGRRIPRLLPRKGQKLRPPPATVPPSPATAELYSGRVFDVGGYHGPFQARLQGRLYHRFALGLILGYCRCSLMVSQLLTCCRNLVVQMWGTRWWGFRSTRRRGTGRQTLLSSTTSALSVFASCHLFILFWANYMKMLC